MSLYRERDKEILVDFDATLCEWSYPDLGEPTDGARQAMRFLRSKGFKVVVWSSRFSPEFNTPEEVNKAIAAVNRWMQKHEIPFDDIDRGDNGKRLCAAYIDDMAVGFSGNWQRTVSAVLRLVELRKTRHE